MNREINEIFKQWKQFLSWCYENNDKTTEIHRDNLEKVMAYTRQLENIINELERYINEEYIYDELGMKIFDASELQDKLQELKGSDK